VGDEWQEKNPERIRRRAERTDGKKKVTGGKGLHYMGFKASANHGDRIVPALLLLLGE
jgi:hypothetical protein